MNLTAVDLDEIIKVAAESGEITRELERLEQLPQILKLYGVKVKSRKYNLRGPDGTEIVFSPDLPFAETPLADDPVGWAFPKVVFRGLSELVDDTLRCEETGLRSFLTLNPWQVNLGYTSLPPFYLSENDPTRGIPREEKVETRLVKPVFEVLTPLFRRRLKTDEFCCTSVAVVSPESPSRIGLVSDEAFRVELREGWVVTDRPVLVLKGVSLWDLYKASWFLKNGVSETPCKPKYAARLLQITPDSVIPLNYEYKNNTLSLTLLNLDDSPHLVTLIGAFRIRRARVLYPGEERKEELVSEFDRVKFVIGRWRVVSLELEIAKLIEPYLKKKSLTLK
jgi:hypothetical protein